VESPPPAEDQAASQNEASLNEAFLQLALLEPEPDEDAGPSKFAHVPDTAPDDVPAAVIYWLGRYNRNTSEAVRNIRDLAAKAPELVVETVLPLQKTGGWGEASRFLASLLCSNGRMAAKLCDPAASLEESVSVAKALSQHEPRFDARFARSLLDDSQMTEAARERGLVVLEKLGNGGRLIPILIQFLRDPDHHIQAKAALMFGRIGSTSGIVDRLMRDKDARIRANFVEGLWNCTANEECLRLFRRFLEDPHHRVVGNAVVGLHRLGEHSEVIKHLAKMTRRPEASFRASAAWVMGQTGEERYISVLRHLVRDPDPSVRHGALRSLRRINLARVPDPPAESEFTGGANTAQDTPPALG
jgi:hypothetical protein